MPTYTIDMRGSGANQAWGEGLSALASAFSNAPGVGTTRAGPASMGGGTRTEAQQLALDKAYYTNDKLYEEARNLRRANDVWEQMNTALTGVDLTAEDRMFLFVENGAQWGLTGEEVGDWLRVLGGYGGVPQERMDQLAQGAGANWADTSAGVNDAQAHEIDKLYAAPFESDLGTFFNPNDPRIPDGVDGTFIRNNTTVGKDDALIPGGEGFLTANTAPSGPPVPNPEFDQTRPPSVFNNPTMTPPPAPGNTFPENTIFGIDADPATLEGQSGVAPYEGTAMEAQALNLINTINEKLRTTSWENLSPAEQNQYTQAFARQFGPKRETRSNPVDKSTVVIETPGEAPPGVFIPPSLQGVIRTMGAPLATDAGTAASGEAGEDGLPAYNVQEIMAGKEGLSLTEAQLRQVALGGQFAANTYDLARNTGYDPTTDSWPGGGEWPTAWGDFAEFVEARASGALGRWLAGDQRNEFNALRFAAIEPLLRLMSGAATPDAEVARYNAYAPQSGLSEAENQRRMRALMRRAESMIAIARAQGISMEELEVMDEATLAVLRAQALNQESQHAITGLGAGSPGASGSVDTSAGKIGWTVKGE